MIDIKNSRDCCGCTACASICTQGAITMQPDALGFNYPKVDMSKCINCGLCNKVCQFNEFYDTSLNIEPPIAFGARQKNVEEVMKSRSGGVFAALTDCILDEGGVVYGAGFDNNYRVAHKRATTKSERDEFRGSKYVQSDMSNIYRQVKDDLRKEKTVLFSGTPCQTAGLNSYVGRKWREKLILVDIVCDGVPSPKFFEDFVKSSEKQHSSQLINFDFRDKKTYGWKDHKETLIFANQEQFSAFHYSYFFFSRLLTRPSCGSCKYTNLRRPSDITLADFWGFEKTCQEINPDNKGCSLVIVNSEKGMNLFNSVKGTLNSKQVLIEDALQPNLVTVHSINPNADKFFKDYESKGFDYVVHKYGNTSFKYRMNKFICRVVKKFSHLFSH